MEVKYFWDVSFHGVREERKGFRVVGDGEARRDGVWIWRTGGFKIERGLCWIDAAIVVLGQWIRGPRTCTSRIGGSIMGLHTITLFSEEARWLEVPLS